MKILKTSLILLVNKKKECILVFLKLFLIQGTFHVYFGYVFSFAVCTSNRMISSAINYKYHEW